MKKRVVAVLLIGIMMSFSACGKPEPAPTPAPQPAETESTVETEESKEEEKKEITVSFSDAHEELMDEEDAKRVLCNFDYQNVTVEIPEYPEAAEKINNRFEQIVIGNRNTAEQFKDWAKEELEFRAEDEWNPYEIGSLYEAKRVDENIISIQEIYYEYTGGAHPNGYQVGYNFDAKTGELLDLSNAFQDPEDLKMAFRSFLEEELKKDEYADRLYPDYEFDPACVDDIMTNDTWFLDENGITFVCNEYIIGPHAAGVFLFTMPYDAYGKLLNEAYLPE